VSGSKREVAHLAFDSAEIASVLAGHDAFFKYLDEGRLVKGPSLLRGE
jgi:hypothetical protein